MFLFTYAAKNTPAPSREAWKFVTDDLESGKEETSRRFGERAMAWSGLTAEEGYAGFGAVRGAHSLQVTVENIERV